MTAVTPQEQILGIVNNHWQSCAVGAAAQLELADLLTDGPVHVDTRPRENRRDAVTVEHRRREAASLTLRRAYSVK